MPTLAERITTTEEELAEVQAAIRGIAKGGAQGSARAGRSVTFISLESLIRQENRLTLRLNRLRNQPETMRFGPAS